jgi:hypothetical protein
MTACPQSSGVEHVRPQSEREQIYIAISWAQPVPQNEPRLCGGLARDLDGVRAALTAVASAGGFAVTIIAAREGTDRATLMTGTLRRRRIRVARPTPASSA